MSYQISETRPATIRRVVHDGSRRRSGVAKAREFRVGDGVRSLTEVCNDGIYPHRDIGETLVFPGDAGVVRTRWSFLGEVYYTVEFGARAAVVIMRGREMATAACGRDGSGQI